MSSATTGRFQMDNDLAVESLCSTPASPVSECASELVHAGSQALLTGSELALPAMLKNGSAQVLGNRHLFFFN